MVKKASLLVLVFIFACTSFTRGQDKKPAEIGPIVQIEPWLLHERLKHEVLPEYPASVRANHIEGDVLVDVVVDENGRIQKAVALRWQVGSPVLGDAAEAAVKKWEYQPVLKDGKPVPVSSYIVFRFRSETEPHIEVVPRPSRGFTIVGSHDRPAPAIAPRKFEMIPEGLAKAHLIHKVNPEYPQMARVAHIEGQVLLQCVISKHGDVESSRAISGHPILIQAARDAVRQWKYSPFLVDGNPVEIETSITVTFHL